MGLIVNRDLLYGLPHIGCHYQNSSVNSNRLDDDAVCVCCGRLATNAHHYPPKGTAPVRHRNGLSLILRPALFAVCGSGTTGCHNGWHGGARFEAWWTWDNPFAEKFWEDGTLLKLYQPHDARLYELGCWTIRDKKLGYTWEVRCE